MVFRTHVGSAYQPVPLTLVPRNAAATWHQSDTHVDNDWAIRRGKERFRDWIEWVEELW